MNSEVDPELAYGRFFSSIFPRTTSIFLLFNEQKVDSFEPPPLGVLFINSPHNNARINCMPHPPQLGDRVGLTRGFDKKYIMAHGWGI